VPALSRPHPPRASRGRGRASRARRPVVTRFDRRPPADPAGPFRSARGCARRFASIPVTASLYDRANKGPVAYVAGRGASSQRVRPSKVAGPVQKTRALVAQSRSDRKRPRAGLPFVMSCAGQSGEGPSVLGSDSGTRTVDAAALVFFARSASQFAHHPQRSSDSTACWHGGPCSANELDRSAMPGGRAAKTTVLERASVDPLHSGRLDRTTRTRCCKKLAHPRGCPSHDR